jgi:uncharacterized protein (TIGR03437 family)
MLVTPASLAFTVQYGVANVPADQALTITSTGSLLSYFAAVQNPPGGNWLIAKNAGNGDTPGSFSVGVSDFSNLVPGDYTGSVTIVSGASNSPVTVPVKLTVLPAASLTVNPSAFTINQVVGSNSIARQDLSLASGTTSQSFITIATTNNGGPWLAVSTAQGNTPTTITAILNSTGLGVAQYTGTITIIPASGVAQTVMITLNVLSSATLTATPGQLVFTAQQGGVLPAPQAVTVSSGASLNVAISTATQTGSNWLTASPANGGTPLNLSVSVSPNGLQPGNYSGAISITPSDPGVAPLTFAVNLIVTPSGPVITAVTNAASYAPVPISPGEIVTIFGGTQVFFDGYPAPLVYSSATQVSAIVPYEIGGSQATSVVIQYQGARSVNVSIPVLDALPGIFTIDASGHGQGAIVNQDSTVNSSQNGADPGSVVSIYITGGGQTNPPSVDGTLAADARSTLVPVKVQIAGEIADVLYAGAAPGEPSGVVQVNARIPADVARGTNASVVIIAGSANSQSGVTLAMKP